MNLPTKITIARLILIPFILLFYCLSALSRYYFIGVTVLFMVASVTDYLDGYLARKNNQTTDLGKFLDPIADKVLVVSTLLILLDAGIFPRFFGIWACAIIIAREFIIGAFRQIAASKGFVLAADKWGKAKTAVTLLSMPPLLLTPVFSAGAARVFWWIGIVLFALATLLTVVSGVNYVLKNVDVLKKGE